MAANPVDIIKQTDAALAQLQARLTSVQTTLVGISAEARKSATALNASKGKGGSGARNAIQSQQIASQKLTAVMKEQQRLRAATITQLGKLAGARSNMNKLLNKARIETQIANRLAREEAILASKVTTEYQKLVVKMNQAGRAYQSLVAKKSQGIALSRKENTQLENSARKFKRYEQAVRKADHAINRHHRNVGNYQSGLRKLGSSLRTVFAAFGLLGGVTLFAQAIQDAFKLTRQLDSLRFAMQAVITDAQELAQTQRWLKQITNDFGAELVTTTERYIKFRAAAQNAGFTAKATQKIFGTMTKAAGVLGLRTDELTGIYLALEQMISKGKITTEELRRQLGERLPAAMDIMARSMGVTTAELDSMMKKGLVITKDVLPAFAEEVERAFGIENVEKVETLQAATVRLKNAWTNLVKDFSDTNPLVKDLMNAIDFLADNLKKIVKFALQVAKAWVIWKGTMLLVAGVMGAINGALAIMAFRLKAIKIGLRAATIEMNLFNIATKANPIMLVVSALVAIGSAIYVFSQKTSQATKDLEAFNDELDRLDGRKRKIESVLGTYAEGADRLQAATLAGYNEESQLLTELSNSMDKNNKILGEKNSIYKDGVKIAWKMNDAQKEAALERAKELIHSKQSLEDIDKILEFEGKFTEAQKKRVRSAVAAMQTINSVQDEQTQIIETQADEQAEIDKKLKDKMRTAEYNLAKYRLQQQINTLKETKDNEDLGWEERLAAQKEFVLKSIELEALTRDYNTSPDNLEAENLLALEQYEDKKTAILQNGIEERNKILKAGVDAAGDLYERLREDEQNEEDEKFWNNLISEGMNALATDLNVPVNTLYEEFNDLYEWDFQNFLAFSKKKVDQTQLEAEARKEALLETLSVIGQFGNAMFELGATIHDRRIQRYDDEIEKNKDFYAQLLDNENLSLEERAALEAKRDAKERQLEKKRRAAEQEKARLQKAQQAFEVIINTSSAVVEALPNIPLAVAVGAIGAINLATVLATPVPEYAKGKGDYDNYEGFAIWGEKRREAKISKDGSVEISPKKISNHLTHVKSDDIIHPNAEKFMSELQLDDVNARSYNFVKTQTKLPEFNNSQVLAARLDNQTNRMVSALNKKKMSVKINQTLNIGDDLKFLERLNNTL